MLLVLRGARPGTWCCWSQAYQIGGAGQQQFPWFAQRARAQRQPRRVLVQPQRVHWKPRHAL